MMRALDAIACDLQVYSQTTEIFTPQMIVYASRATSWSIRPAVQEAPGDNCVLPDRSQKDNVTAP
jgi:hypothetical protein